MLGDAIGDALDPVFRKRGFANQSIVTHWQSIAPAPYNTVSMPDSLKWPRGAASAEGAILFLRCSQGHALALSHEGAAIAQAVNQYFGYFLVGSVKLSAAPFSPHSAPKDKTMPTPSPELLRQVDDAVEQIKDDGLRQALHKLGLQLMSKRKN